MPGGTVTEQRFDPEARVAGSIHNFWEDSSPACGADVDGGSRAVQHADAIVWNMHLARVTLPPLIRCRLFIDALKPVAAFTVYVKCHLTVSLEREMLKNRCCGSVRPCAAAWSSVRSCPQCPQCPHSASASSASDVSGLPGTTS